ncbi:MAG: restriction endonuclease [Nanoarchaeota archaeon]|nr:restriction endonuclease [Nanoarchaeota archaeon]MBU1631774.1 restriction endonuclease [Nanoarchaeota archaeon]MBU1876174.1 restriction endonuclease [Nanoarchaeota archaeon]
MNLNTKSISKNEKRRIILDYVKRTHSNENRFVSKREIRKFFHVELYNYFENIFDMYQQLNIEILLCFCPKDYAKKKIIEYVRERSKKNIYPFKKEIEAELKIHIYSYYKGIKHLYQESGVDFRLYQKRVYDLETHSNSDLENLENRNKILNLIREGVKEGMYPSTMLIQEKLNLAFYKYFNDIYEAYEKAGVNYDRPCPIILGKKKEKVLTEIAIYLLRRMGYEIKRVSILDKNNYNCGEDINVVDKNGNEFLIEIKAYGKNKRVTKREIDQLINYVKNRSGSKGIIITTSEVISRTKENILIIDGKELVDLVYIHRLTSFLEDIKWIQLAKVNKKEIIEAKTKKRKEIVEFIRKNPNMILPLEIEKSLRLDLRTYFGKRSIKLIERIKENPNIYSDPAYKVPL